MTAQALDHLGNHMIGPDADAIAQQLHRQMPVAQVPGDAHQFAVLMRVDFQQLFRLGADANDTRFHQQTVAVAQPHRLRQIDQELRPELVVRTIRRRWRRS